MKKAAKMVYVGFVGVLACLGGCVPCDASLDEWCLVEPPPPEDPCEPLQQCLDGAADPCGAYGQCTLGNRDMGTECHPTCNGVDCVLACGYGEPNCVPTWECMFECPAICEDPTIPTEERCVYQCWDTSPDCLGQICYGNDGVGCSLGECP